MLTMIAKVIATYTSIRRVRRVFERMRRFVLAKRSQRFMSTSWYLGPNNDSCLCSTYKEKIEGAFANVEAPIERTSFLQCVHCPVKFKFKSWLAFQACVLGQVFVFGVWCKFYPKVWSWSAFQTPWYHMEQSALCP